MSAVQCHPALVVVVVTLQFQRSFELTRFVFDGVGCAVRWRWLCSKKNRLGLSAKQLFQTRKARKRTARQMRKKEAFEDRLAQKCKKTIQRKNKKALAKNIY